jgi:polyhydroxybutyrate depolymerase
MLSPGDHRIEVVWQDRPRRAIVHVPPDASGRLSVVLALHGSGTNARGMREFCGLDITADKSGFVVVFPEGTGRVEHARTWNAGDCCGHAKHQKSDDVGFLRALLDRLEHDGTIDARRIHATGMSNGGMMAYRLAAEAADVVASVCSVCGPLAIEPLAPSRPVSILHFHGTKDLFTPFHGGKGPRSISVGHSFRSVEQTIQAWVAANSCAEEPGRTLVSDGHDDGLPVVRRTYSHGRDGSEVVLYVIENGGHTWPGRVPTLEFLGSSTLQVSANDLMWEFFQKHPMKA